MDVVSNQDSVRPTESDSKSECASDAGASAVSHGQELKIPGPIQIFENGDAHISPVQAALLKRRFAIIRRAERSQARRVGSLPLKARKKLLERLVAK